MARPVDELEAILAKTVGIAAVRMPLTAAYLFGSYAEGKPHEYSDIDIALFSPAAESMPLREKMNLLTDIEMAVGGEVQLHLFSDKCLTEARPTNIYGHILATGRRIA